MDSQGEETFRKPNVHNQKNLLLTRYSKIARSAEKKKEY
jgi:hypothetical protein